MRNSVISLGLTGFLMASCQSSTTDVLDTRQLAQSAQQEQAALQQSPETTAAISTSNPPQDDQLPTQSQQSSEPTVVASLAPPADDQFGVASPAIQTSDPNQIQQHQNAFQDIQAKPRTRKTYLLNGLVSAVPFIGFGLTNLQKKVPDAKLYSYLSPVEGSVAVAPAVTSDIIKAHRQDPDVEVNLIGISYGANLITQIASTLDKKGIKVNYLGIIEGTTLRRIPPNVEVADNFTCTNLDCTRATARLASGNNVTRLQSFKFRTSHIPMGNNKKMHERIIRQING